MTSDPHSPIEGRETGCLSAGSTAKIICDTVGFPPPMVEFWKDCTKINYTANERLVSIAVIVFFLCMKSSLIVSFQIHIGM